MSLVLGGSDSRAIRGHIGLGQSTVHNEVSGVDETTLITGQEHSSVGLLNGLPETSGREVDLTAKPLGFVIAQEFLEHGGAVGMDSLSAQHT